MESLICHLVVTLTISGPAVTSTPSYTPQRHISMGRNRPHRLQDRSASTSTTQSPTMKLTAISLLLGVAALILAAPAPASTYSGYPNHYTSSCLFQPVYTIFGRRYEVKIQAGGSYGDLIHPSLAEFICHKFWHNLRRFSQCAAVSSPTCDITGKRGSGYGDGLLWKFDAPSICNRGMVASAYWEGTGGGKMGTLKCHKDPNYNPKPLAHKWPPFIYGM